jgi:histidine triad (HIT) family protein
MKINYTGNDFYCDVIQNHKSDLQIEFENDFVVACHHTKPSYPVHITVSPKKHIPSFTVWGDEEDEKIVAELLKVVRQIARKVELEKGECRIITNLGNYQDSKHLHFHVCSGDKYKK